MSNTRLIIDSGRNFAMQPAAVLLSLASFCLFSCSTPRPDPVADAFEAAFVRELMVNQEAGAK